MDFRPAPGINAAPFPGINAARFGFALRYAFR